MKNLYKLRKILFLFLTMMCIFMLCSCGAKEINLADYLVAEFEGLDGDGSVEAHIDYSKLAKDMKKDDKSDEQELYEKMPEISFEMEENEDKLKNGDKITFRVYGIGNMDDKDYKFIEGSKTFTVENLEEAEILDPFKDIDVYFVGDPSNSDLYVINRSDNELLKHSSYDSDRMSGLKIGDKIEIGVSGAIAESARENKIVIKDTKKTYIVEKVNGLIKDISEIDKESLDSLIKRQDDMVERYLINNALDIIKSLGGETDERMYERAYDPWSGYDYKDASSKFTKKLSKIYFLKPKNNVASIFSRELCLLYKITVSNDLNETPLQGYLSLPLNPLIKGDDGKILIPYKDYQYNSAIILPNSYNYEDIAEIIRRDNRNTIIQEKDID